MRSLHQAPPAPTSAFERRLVAARGGDTAALDALFEEFYPRVERLVHRGLAQDLRRSRSWLSARFSTGDVVQEVFRSVLQTLDGFGGRREEEFAGYLARIVRNRLLDVLRYHEADRRDGRRTDGGPEQLELPSPDSGPATRAAREEELSMYRQVLAGFPEAERRLLRARLERDLDFPAIADELGYSSTSACRRAFFAARARLIVRLRSLEAERGA